MQIQNLPGLSVNGRCVDASGFQYSNQLSQTQAGVQQLSVQDQIQRRDQLLQKAKATINLLMEENDKLSLENKHLKQQTAMYQTAGAYNASGQSQQIQQIQQGVIEQKDLKINELNQQLSELTAHNLELNQALAKLRSSQSYQQQQTNTALKQLVTSQEIEFQQQMIQMHGQVNELTMQNEELRRQLNVRDQQVSQFKLQLGNQESSVRQCKEELTVLQRKLERKDEELQQAVEGRRQDRDQVRELTEQLRDISTKNEELASKVQDLQNTIVDKSLLIQKHEKDISIIGNDLKYHKDISNELKQTISNLNGQLDVLQQNYKVKCDALAESMKIAETAAKNSAQHEKRHEDIQRDMDKLLRKHNDLNSDYQALICKTEERKHEVMKLTAENESLNRTIDSLNGSIDQQNKQFQAQAEQVLRLGVENKRLNEQLVARGAEMKELQSLAERTQGENTTLRASVEEFNRLNGQISAKLSEQNAQLEVRESNSKKLIAENQVLTKQLDQISGNFNKVSIDFQNQIAAKESVVRACQSSIAVFTKTLKQTYQMLLQLTAKDEHLNIGDLQEQFDTELGRLSQHQGAEERDNVEQIAHTIQNLVSKQVEVVADTFRRLADERDSNSTMASDREQQMMQLRNDIQLLNQTIQYLQENQVTHADAQQKLKAQNTELKNTIQNKEVEVLSLKAQLQQNHQHQQNVKSFVEDCKARIQQYELSTSNFQQMMKSREEQISMQMVQQQQLYREKIGQFCQEILSQIKSGAFDKDVILRMVVQLSREM